MPVVSEAQRRFMFATEKGQTDAPPSVGRDFINASHGLRNLPKRVKHKIGKRTSVPVTFGGA